MRISLSADQHFNSIFWSIKINRTLRNALLILFGSLLLTFASKINVSLIPVPVTLQTLAVFFIGMTYGWRLGGLTVLAYLFEGLLGLPVFASAYVGLPALLGPTGGYLFGFIPAAILSGYLSEHGFGRHPLKVAFAALMGTIPLYVCGLMVLASFVGIDAAINLGLKPFLLGDALKIIFLAAVVPAFWRENN